MWDKIWPKTHEVKIFWAFRSFIGTTRIIKHTSIYRARFTRLAICVVTPGPCLTQGPTISSKLWEHHLEILIILKKNSIFYSVLQSYKLCSDPVCVWIERWVDRSQMIDRWCIEIDNDNDDDDGDIEKSEWRKWISGMGIYFLPYVEWLDLYFPA